MKVTETERIYPKMRLKRLFVVLTIVILASCSWQTIKERAQKAKVVTYGGVHAPPVTADGVTKDEVEITGIVNEKGAKKIKGILESLHPLADDAAGLLTFLAMFALGKEPEEE